MSKKEKVRSSAFRRLLLLGLLISAVFPLPSAAETYILPARADLGFCVPTVSIPLADYTNCVAFYSAEAPVFNAGQTNYFVPDLSPALNDATQPVVDYQPTRRNVAGTWCIEADGVDDWLALDVDASYSRTYALRFEWPAVATNMAMFGNNSESYYFDNCQIRSAGGFWCRGGGPDYRCQIASAGRYNLFGAGYNWLVIRRDFAAKRYHLDTLDTDATVNLDSYPPEYATTATRLFYTKLGGGVSGVGGYRLHSFLSFRESLDDAKARLILTN